MRIAELRPGMATTEGRVVELGDGLAILRPDGTTVAEVPDPVGLDLSDRATFWLALETVALRTGLDPSGGLLWTLEQDPMDDGLVWVLEAADETRTREGDTDDPEQALANALVDTATSE